MLDEIIENISDYVKNVGDIVLTIKDTFINSSNFLISPFKETLILFLGIIFTIIIIKAVRYII